MAGNNRFHNKAHRADHHTTAVAGVPTSAQDPIASPAYPFQGDFYLVGSLSASNALSATSAYFRVLSAANGTVNNLISTSATINSLSSNSLSAVNTKFTNLNVINNNTFMTIFTTHLTNLITIFYILLLKNTLIYV